jgi:hypothetical protein
MPVAGFSGSVAYPANAPKLGVRVPPRVSQKPPKLQKTVAGKVLPRIHSRMPLKNIKTPPKKK